MVHTIRIGQSYSYGYNILRPRYFLTKEIASTRIKEKIRRKRYRMLSLWWRVWLGKGEEEFDTSLKLWRH